MNSMILLVGNTGVAVSYRKRVNLVRQLECRVVVHRN